MDDEGAPLFTLGIGPDGEPWVKAAAATQTIKDPAAYSTALGLLINEMRDKLNLTDDKAFHAFMALALKQTPESPTPQKKPATTHVTLSGKNLRTGRRETHDIAFADLVDVAGNEDVVYLTLKNTMMGIIMNDAYQATKLAMGKRDFKYFLDEANLTFALYAYPADIKALHTIFAYARHHQLFTKLATDEYAAEDVPDTPAEFDNFMQSVFDDMSADDPDDGGAGDNVVPFRPKD
ncbi:MULTISPECIES: hypothetical protein [Levilactobacillus]|uniref:hypothetical protein n=1 Tax=Levilactobacillus TaxID=2767886 RepID=UPI00194F6323|nr:hypothetical protein [Levilactobacillus sp. 244-2]